MWFAGCQDVTSISSFYVFTFCFLFKLNFPNLQAFNITRLPTAPCAAWVFVAPRCSLFLLPLCGSLQTLLFPVSAVWSLGKVDVSWFVVPSVGVTFDQLYRKLPSSVVPRVSPVLPWHMANFLSFFLLTPCFNVFREGDFPILRTRTGEDDRETHECTWRKVRNLFPALPLSTQLRARHAEVDRLVGPTEWHPGWRT